jgi:hypothetical protein
MKHDAASSVRDAKRGSHIATTFAVRRNGATAEIAAAFALTSQKA